MRKPVFFLLLFCLAALPVSAENLVAPVYSGAVPCSSDSPGCFLTKQSYDQVKTFYERDSGTTNQERVVDGNRSARFEYMSVMEVQEYDSIGSAIGVVISERPNRPASAVEQALGNLKGLSLQGSLSPAEYERLAEEYTPVIQWFFPKSETGLSMDEVIYQRCEKGQDEENLQQNAEAMAKKAQELMAQGRHQEAMQILHQMGQSAQQYHASSAVGEGAVRKWTGCLNEMKQNGYPTKIDIALHPSAAPR